MYQQQIQQNQSSFAEIFRICFDSILFSPITNVIVCVGGLSQLIKHFPNYFDEYKNRLFEHQQTDNHKQLVFDKFQTIQNGINETNFNDILNRSIQELKGNIDVF